jgi:hypothetical protein
LTLQEVNGDTSGAEALQQEMACGTAKGRVIEHVPEYVVSAGLAA